MRLFAVRDTHRWPMADCRLPIADCHWWMPLIVIHHVVGGPASAPVRFQGPSISTATCSKSRAPVALISSRRWPTIKANSENKNELPKKRASNDFFVYAIAMGYQLESMPSSRHLVCSSFHFTSLGFVVLWPPTHIVALNLSHVSINLA